MSARGSGPLLLVVSLSVALGARTAEAKKKPKAATKAAAPATTNGCEDGASAAVWISPQAPVAGAPVQIFAVADGGAPGELVATGEGGKRVPLTPVRRGTAPLSLSADLPAPR